MHQLPRLISNDSEGKAVGHDPSPGGHSCSQIRIGVPRQRANGGAALGEELLQWLHDGLDQPGAARSDDDQVFLGDFEQAIIDRLFPLQDIRSFITRLREHSRATAITARVVARHAGIGAIDTTYVAGWLHDMGIALQLRRLNPRQFATENDAFERIWPSLLNFAPALGVSLATQWRLPSMIRHAIREHNSFGTIRSVHAVSGATFVAEHLAGCLGFGFRDEQPTTGLRVALSALNLSERDLAPMGRRAEQLLGYAGIHWMACTLSQMA
jgi:hypothetical protein